MAHFSQDFLDFFNELTENNNKEWFDENRKRYEKSVKDTFKAFVQEMIDRLNEFEPITITTSEAIFRINRDIRFSADKTPYKTQVSAIISPGGKKDKTTPGIYFELSPKDVRVYSGAHMLDKDQLSNVRHYIADNLEEFEKLINEKEFKSKFGEILGEKNKRIPKELEEAAEKQPLIYNKSFYYFTKFDAKTILADDLADKLINYYKVTFGLKDFFTKALQG